MKSLLILLPLLILIESCKKNAANELQKIESIPAHKALSVTLLNPYDSVGVWHNKILDRVLPQIHAITDTNLLTISGMVAACNYSPQKSKPVTLSQNVKISIGGASESYRQLIDQSSLSALAKQYLHRLLGIIDTTSYHNTDKVYSTIKNDIAALEYQVLTDQQLDSNDYRCVLEIISVANHSFDYWFQAGTQRLSLKKIIRTIATITGDIGGAIEGYYTGDIVGTASDASAWWYENITYGMPGKLDSN